MGKVALPTAKTPINNGLYKIKPSNFMNRTNSINTNVEVLQKSKFYLPRLGFAPRSNNLVYKPYGLASSICSLSGRCRTEIRFATCVDKTGKRYNIELDNIRGFEDVFEK